MRHIGISPKPITESGKSASLKLKSALTTYPDHLIRGYFDNIDEKTVMFLPQDHGQGKACSRFMFELGSESRHVRIIDTWLLDLEEDAIDLLTFTGGLVDNLAYSPGRDYLVWAFLDTNLEFAGLGMARKPFTTFSAISGGSANKGTTGKVFTVVDAYQFTIGARVVVRNTNGTAPFYEWNWAIVADITSNTSLVLDMDNISSYGTNITSTTNSEIMQWDNYRPWVVDAGQTLYQPYYSLVGELYTNSSTEFIAAKYRADEEWRDNRVAPLDVILPTSDATQYPYSWGRFIPLWATQMKGAINFQGDLASNFFAAAGVFGDLTTVCQVASILNFNTGVISFAEKYAILYLYGVWTTYTSKGIAVHGYYVPGGMHG